MRYITIILLLTTLAFLLTGCTETTKTVDNSTNNTPEEIPESHNIVLDEPLTIDVEKETVTIELDSGRMFKTLHNESNRTVQMYPKPTYNNESGNETLNSTN